MKWKEISKTFFKSLRIYM